MGDLLLMYVYFLSHGYLEMYDIYPLQRLWFFFCMHVLRTIEDVKSISWIFVSFACLIALIEVGRYIS